MVTASASPGAGLGLSADEAAEADDSYTNRILDAAQHQLELFGLRRTTVEDVAQRAGVARVTVYRRFPGRDHLLAAVVVREARRLFAELDEAAAAPGSLADRITEGFVTALRFTREHVLLQRLLDTEPELLLPLLTRGAEPLLAVARSYLAEQVRAEQRAGGLAAVADPDEAAELVVRLVQSLVLTPGGLLGATDDAAARRLATRYLVPALDLTSTGRIP